MFFYKKKNSVFQKWLNKHLFYFILYTWLLILFIGVAIGTIFFIFKVLHINEFILIWLSIPIIFTFIISSFFSKLESIREQILIEKYIKKYNDVNSLDSFFSDNKVKFFDQFIFCHYVMLPFPFFNSDKKNHNLIRKHNQSLKIIWLLAIIITVIFYFFS